MISIIICSRDTQVLKQISENVALTIGVPFEIQAIDNSKGTYGICEAYNIGAERSTYDILCFMHEDIKFHTQDWGKNVFKTLQDISIGLIGVAGGQVKTKNPEGWWVPGGSYVRSNLIQSFPDDTPTFTNYYNPYDEPISDVVTVDGVWFCCRKSVWKENRFDSTVLKEFHFYDLDFSLQIFKKGLRVCVVYDVLLEHFSPGSVNKSWVKNAAIFSKKWKPYLPMSVHSFSDYKWRKLEYQSCQEFIRVLMSLNIKNSLFFYYLFKYLLTDSRGWTLKKIMKEKVRALVPSELLGSASSKKAAS